MHFTRSCRHRVHATELRFGFDAFEDNAASLSAAIKDMGVEDQSGTAAVITFAAPYPASHIINSD